MGRQKVPYITTSSSGITSSSACSNFIPGRIQKMLRAYVSNNTTWKP